MSVGAGSIKRAARAAGAEKKAEENRAAKKKSGEADVRFAEEKKEAAEKADVGAEEPVFKASEETSKPKKTLEEAEKPKKASKETSKPKKASGESGRQKKTAEEGKKQKGSEGKKKAEAKEAEKTVPKASVPENAWIYEAYGIGQQLPVHLL